jgi:molybdopterin-guanine dinucleotide biosynthesis protein MobB|tara:strand:- start:36 stop:524 length:489 start_codon:yes stop_codon:yes gene_type:complete
MKIFGIVGWKNTGKTFLAQMLIKNFISLGLKVASIKHAHHNFEIDKPETDSFLHRKSGSSQIIISSSNRWAKITELNGKKEKTLNDLINEIDPVDVIVIEGFKKEDHSKFEIIKDPSDPSCFLFPKLKNVIGLISNQKIDSRIKHFKKNDIINLSNYILKTL